MLEHQDSFISLRNARCKLKEKCPLMDDGIRESVTDVKTMLETCLAGSGIAQVMALGIQDHLDSGRLIELFPDWPDEVFPLYSVYPSRRNPPAKVQAFIEFCLEIIRRN